MMTASGKKVDDVEGHQATAVGTLAETHQRTTAAGKLVEGFQIAAVRKQVDGGMVIAGRGVLDDWKIS